ncbi:response regulator [Roseomonas hellenica]|nr:response regulator [Plastoroseomonas hellenica]
MRAERWKWDVAKASVLVVEDEWMIASLIETILHRLGYGVVGPAATAKASIGLLDCGPTLALLDIQLGRETSFPVADALAQRRIPFAFVSAYGRLGLPERFADRTVLTKPFSTEALARVLSTLRGDDTDASA